MSKKKVFCICGKTNSGKYKKPSPMGEGGPRQRWMRSQNDTLQQKARVKCTNSPENITKQRKEQMIAPFFGTLIRSFFLPRR